MPQPNIQLRRANINDLPILLHWDKQQHVIDSDLEVMSQKVCLAKVFTEWSKNDSDQFHWLF
jgi:hypothetical protein